MRRLAVAAVVLAACGDNRHVPDAPPDAAKPDFCVPRHGALAIHELAHGLDQPVFVTAPPGDPRLFVVEKSGRIRVLEHGAVRPEPYADLTDRVYESPDDEQGFLGLAFHPQFAQNGKLYVDYIAIGTAFTQLAELTAEPGAAAVSPVTERRLLAPPRPAGNHNGGMIEFGPDGYLYMSEGDGGGGNDQYGFAERTDSMLAKLLRIDVDHGDPYAIPPTNPWAHGGGVPEMFAWGLRNPWRFSIDPATSDIWIGDVGQDSFEEIDVIPGGTSGQNFGWPVFEGPMCFTSDPGGNVGCDHPEAYDAPVMAIDRRTTNQCAVIGGFVYRGTCALDYQGAYFWGDYCTGEVDYDLKAPKLLGAVPYLTSFGTDGFGELYATGLDGRLYRFEVTD